MEHVKCFLIEPILEDDPHHDPSADSKYSSAWIPGKTIVGWVRSDTGERRTRCSDWGVGAMWFAVWYWRPVEWDNEVEPHLIVRCPSGDGSRDWDIDSRASNCTLRDDRLHRCWVRHGAPPDVHVDKDGLTCSAGAGSIALPGWHGFLTHGYLQEQR